MTADGEIGALCRRLERWAAERAPAMLAELNGPAEPEALAEVERALGMPLGGLAASLRVHDGEREDERIWLEGGRLLPASEILEVWRTESREAAKGDAPFELDPEVMSVSGPVVPCEYSARRIPFMRSDCGLLWYLDFDPAPGGTPGQVILIDLEGVAWSVCAASFADFFRS